MNVLYIIFIFPIEKLIEICLAEIYTLTGNYGLSLILLSIIVNLILIPIYALANKLRMDEKLIQSRMSKDIESINKNYIGQKRYYQIRAVYRHYNYSPLYSLRVSIGFLIQIPFFFAAYHYLSHYQNLNEISFLFIKDLGNPDGFLEGLNLLPLIMTLLSVISGVIYSRNMTNSEKLQLHSLSFIFFLLLYNMPSGLLLYWTTNNAFSLIKNLFKLFNFKSIHSIKEKFLKIDYLQIIDCIVQNKCTAYIVFGALFIVAELMTFYYIYDDIKVPLTKLCIRSSFVLLFATIAVTAPAFVKRYAKSFWSRIILYMMILWTNSIAVILLGRILQNLSIIRYWLNFVIIFQVSVVFIFIYNRYFLLHNDYGIQIKKQLFKLIKYDKKSFIYTLLFFNNIVFILGPSTILYGAPNDFYISYVDIFLWQVYFFIISFTIFYFVFLILPRLLKIILILILQYASATTIIYLVFKQRDIGLMDNFILNVPSNLILKPHEIFIDIFFLYSILLCLCLALRYKQEIIYRGMFYLTIVITLTSVYFAGKIIYYQSKIDMGTISNYELSLSKDRKNVLIFMLDGFSGGAIKDIKDNYPKILEGLDGFTWYPNVLAASAGTWGSIATLYGGHKYSIKNINSDIKKRLRDYFIEAYNFYSYEFSPKGYIVNYINPFLLKCSDIDENINCYRTSSLVTSLSYKIGRSYELKYKYDLPLLVNFVSFFKAAPHIFKKFIYDNGEWHGITSRGIIQIRKMDQWSFFQNIEKSIKVDQKPTFNFLDLTMPHLPFVMNSKCEFSKNGATYLNEASCALININKIIKQMKKNDVYDNTMIVLVSDHGYWVENKMFDEEEFTEKVQVGNERRLRPGFVNPLLMVKDIDSRGRLKISNVFLSNSDVPSIVCEVIGSCDGIPSDFRKNKEKRKLTIDVYIPESSHEFLSDYGFKNIKERFEVTDNIFNPGNWKKIEVK